MATAQTTLLNSKRPQIKAKKSQETNLSKNEAPHFNFTKKTKTVTTNKNSVKVIARFFNKTTAKNEITYQRKLAKQCGKKIAEIEAADAYSVYNNAFFKAKIQKIGSPESGQLIIVVYYKTEVITSRKKKKSKPIDMIEPEQNVIPLRAPKMVNLKVSEKAAKARTILIALNTKNNSNLIKKTGRTFEFRPSYHLELIA